MRSIWISCIIWLRNFLTSINIISFVWDYWIGCKMRIKYLPWSIFTSTNFNIISPRPTFSYSMIIIWYCFNYFYNYSSKPSIKISSCGTCIISSSMTIINTSSSSIVITIVIIIKIIPRNTMEVTPIKRIIYKPSWTTIYRYSCICIRWNTTTWTWSWFNLKIVLTICNYTSTIWFSILSNSLFIRIRYI